MLVLYYLRPWKHRIDVFWGKLLVDHLFFFYDTPNQLIILGPGHFFLFKSFLCVTASKIEKYIQNQQLPKKKKSKKDLYLTWKAVINGHSRLDQAACTPISKIQFRFISILKEVFGQKRKTFRSCDLVTNCQLSVSCCCCCGIDGKEGQALS